MLYVLIGNVTGNGKLADDKGLATYDVAVMINHVQLAHYTVKDFERAKGWAKLLQEIGKQGEQHDTMGQAHKRRGPKGTKV